MKVKEAMNPEDIFGDLKEYTLWSMSSMLVNGDIITITNSNCEMDFDNLSGRFLKEPAFFCFKVELELIEVDLRDYELKKSNNGGGYAFAKCRVVKIIEEGY